MDQLPRARVDEVYLLYTRFVNTPASGRDRAARCRSSAGAGRAQPTADVEYIFEPTPEAVLDELLPRYVEIDSTRLSSRRIVQRAQRPDGRDAQRHRQRERHDRDADADYNKARQAQITTETARDRRPAPKRCGELEQRDRRSIGSTTPVAERRHRSIAGHRRRRRRRVPAGAAARDLQRARSRSSAPALGETATRRSSCEVQQHLGNNWVRAVAMDSTDGLRARHRRRRHRRADHGARRREHPRPPVQRARRADRRQGPVDGRAALPDPPHPPRPSTSRRPRPRSSRPASRSST